MTAKLEGIAPAEPERPVPTAIVASWFPAFVSLPGGSRAASVRVLATDVGLYVFDRKPAADGDMSTALFFSPIDWSDPATGNRLPQPRLAFTIGTEAGEVGVTPMQGCGCGQRPLKNWVPLWAARSVPWGGRSAS